MLDVKLLRSNLTAVTEKLKYRNEDISQLQEFEELDKQRLSLIQETEDLKRKRNLFSKEIANKLNNKDLKSEKDSMRLVSQKIHDLDSELKEIEDKVHHILLSLPNIADENVPIGLDENENVVLRKEGIIEDSTNIKPHWEVADYLDILDFERGAKVTGSRFVFYKGLGATLERALMNFMLDLHTQEHQYTEMLPPYLVNESSMLGTGQFPKFGEDVFSIKDSNYHLIPTAEVPITNYYANEILSVTDLPQKFVAYSSCYRSEAGSAGKDTRGLIRLHQFQKIELVKFVHPQHSDDEHIKLLQDAEKVLKLLELPYRVVLMCTGDMGFAQRKKYDLEVWMPASKCYREISSCSNFGDFQARRANIRFRPSMEAKPEFVHTINGSGLALGRTVAAILENYQEENCTIRVPDKLKSYMNGLEYIL